ncbi:MAG: CoA transferase, partial [candidate division NC10 bacterium]|nr:CoA transferase [candidate division NC10 bacterium]
QAAIGLLAALLKRERDGTGQYLDISMLDAQVFLLATMIPAYFATGIVPEPMGSAHPSIVPYQAFPTKDISINIAVTNEKFWLALCKALGKPELADDPRFQTNAKRVEHRGELLPIIEEVLLTKTGDEWIQILRAEGIPCGPILTFDRLFQDPQIQARKMTKTFDHETAGPITVVGTPFKLSSTPARLSSPPPALGQHTDEVLATLGYDPQTILALRKKEVIA